MKKICLLLMIVLSMSSCLVDQSAANRTENILFSAWPPTEKTYNGASDDLSNLVQITTYHENTQAYESEEGFHEAQIVSTFNGFTTTEDYSYKVSREDKKLFLSIGGATSEITKLTNNKLVLEAKTITDHFVLKFERTE